MSYTPSTDFIALLRSTAGGATLARMPGLDYAIEALARAGLINLSVGPTAPLVNQNVTVWFQPAATTYSAEGVVFLWNPALSVYQAATPALWALLLSGATPSGTLPLQDGTASVGASLSFARADHVHPTDTTRAPLASPTFTGTPSAPTPATGDNDNSIATTAFVQTTVNLASPIGTIAAYAGAVAPTNYAILNGQAINRVTYATLFAAIGIVFGAGDGTTTFNLPDLRGRVVAGVDGGVGRLTTATMSSQALAGVGGLELLTLLRSDLPNVAPTFTGSAGTATSTNSNIPVNASTPLTATGPGAVTPITGNIVTNLSSTYTPSGTVQSLNGGVAQTTPGKVQPTMELNYIIRIL